MRRKALRHQSSPVGVRVPATLANLGPGFDTFGLAVKVHNRITLEEGGVQRTSFAVEGEGRGVLPENGRNLVWKAMERIFTRARVSPPPLQITMTNRIPLSRGLGSSAAAIVGGMVAANLFLRSPFSREEIFQEAARMEGHPDNVAPALFGGMTIVLREGDDFFPFPLNLPLLKSLKIILAIPDFHLSTSMARKILPEKLLLSDAVFNVGRASLLIASLAGIVQGGRLASPEQLLSLAMEDRLHEPYRKKLVPGYDRVREAALGKGALGVTISGSGPTVLAIVRGEENKVARAMGTAFRKAGVRSRIVVTGLEPAGASESSDQSLKRL